jgi:hypothetical protein
MRDYFEIIPNTNLCGSESAVKILYLEFYVYTYCTVQCTVNAITYYIYELYEIVNTAEEEYDNIVIITTLQDLGQLDCCLHFVISLSAHLRIVWSLCL